MILEADAIGKNIREIRKTAKESQEKFAEQIETTTRTVSNIENGDVIPSLQTVANISEKFGYSIDSIIQKPSYTYRVNETTVYDENSMAHKVYGIDALDREGNIVKSFTDIFFERPKAEKTVNLCNMYKLSLVHLQDVLEDIINE